MNERLQELVEQARVQDRGYFIYQYGGPTGHQSVEKAIDLEKFSELIVRECAYIIEAQDVDPAFKHRMSWAMKEKFGVEE